MQFGPPHATHRRVKFSSFRVLRPIWLGIIVSICCKGSAQLAPDEIIRRSVEANNRDWRLGPAYSHFEHDVDQKGDERIDRTYEVSLMDGSTYRRLMAVNGQPIPPVQQSQEELKEKRELARRRSETPAEREARIRKYQVDREHDYVLMTQMAVAFTFRLLGSENLNGHETYVLDAEPKPNYHPVNRDAKVLTGMHGKLWVDVEHFHWAKVEAEVVRPVSFGGFIARVGPGTRFVLSKEPVGDDVWQPSDFTMQVIASVLFFQHNSTSTQHFSGYRAGGAITMGIPRGFRPAEAFLTPGRAVSPSIAAAAFPACAAEMSTSRGSPASPGARRFGPT